MRKIKNVNEIAKDDLKTIHKCLVKFDKYISSVTRQPTDRNIGLYEHWIDCMGDIERIILTENRWQRSCLTGLNGSAKENKLVKS